MLLVPLSMMVGARFLRVRARASTGLNTRPYECGEEAALTTRIAFHPRWVVAIFARAF